MIEGYVYVGCKQQNCQNFHRYIDTFALLNYILRYLCIYRYKYTQKAKDRYYYENVQNNFPMQEKTNDYVYDECKTAVKVKNNK